MTLALDYQCLVVTLLWLTTAPQPSTAVSIVSGGNDTDWNNLQKQLKSFRYKVKGLTSDSIGNCNNLNVFSITIPLSIELAFCLVFYVTNCY